MTTDNNILYVDIDKAAFKAEVQKYVDLSPVFAEFAHLKLELTLAGMKPPQLWDTISDIQKCVAAVTAAVEVAKQSILAKSAVPGAKFNKQLALETAVDLLTSYIKFGGIVGSILNSVWKPFLNVLVSVYVNQQKSIDFLATALKILKLAGIITI